MPDEYDMPELHFNPGETNAATGSQPRTTHDGDQSRTKQSASIIRIVMIAVAAIIAVLVILAIGFGIGFGVGFSTGFSTGFSAGVSAECDDCTCPNLATPGATTPDVPTVEVDDPNEMCFFEDEVEEIRQGKDCAEAKIYATPLNTWITFQRRGAFDQDFYRPFHEYEDGFGNICSGGDFWLGLRHLWNLTRQGEWEMRSEVTEFDTGEVYWIEYENFVVGEGPGYILGLGGAYRGNIAGEIGDATNNGWGYHRGMKFTTYDKDQDTYSGYNCASGSDLGGFWYKLCFRVGVNQRQARSDGGVATGCNRDDRMLYKVCNPSCAVKTLRASLIQIRRIR